MYLQRSKISVFLRSNSFQTNVLLAVLKNLNSGDLQRRRQGLLQLLGLGGVVDNQGVLVSGTSDLELGLLEHLALRVDLLVDLDGGRLDVGSSGQLNEFLDVLDLFLDILVYWFLRVM